MLVFQYKNGIKMKYYLFIIFIIIAIDSSFISCKQYALGQSNDKKDSIDFIRKADSLMEKNIIAFDKYPFGMKKSKIEEDKISFVPRINAWGRVDYLPIYKYQRLIGYKILLKSIAKDEFIREVNIIYKKINRISEERKSCNLNEDSLYKRQRFNIYNMQNSVVDAKGDMEITDTSLNAYFTIYSRELR